MKPFYCYLFIMILATSCGSLTSDKIPKEIINYLTKQYLTEGDLRAIDPSDRKFQYHSADLNADGFDEHFILFSSPYFCGSGGCNLLILDKSLSLVTEITLVNPPVLLDSRTNDGWKDLILWSNGDYHRMKFNLKEKSYPTNPSVEELIELESRDLERMMSLFENSTAINTYTF